MTRAPAVRAMRPIATSTSSVEAERVLPRALDTSSIKPGVVANDKSPCKLTTRRRSAVRRR